MGRVEEEPTPAAGSVDNTMTCKNPLISGRCKDMANDHMYYDIVKSGKCIDGTKHLCDCTQEGRTELYCGPWPAGYKPIWERKKDELDGRR